MRFPWENLIFPLEGSDSQPPAQDPSFASRRNAFVTDNVSALAGSAVVSIGSHRRHAGNGSMVVDSKGGAGQRPLQPGPSEDSMSEAVRLPVC